MQCVAASVCSPDLPKVITGPLFASDVAERFSDKTIKRLARAASKRLNRFLCDIGITDRRKVVHSLRHRAKDRARAVGCPLEIQYELFGQEERTVAAGYDVGSPVPLLKRWLDKVGL
jgi:hypothetical protein